VANIQAPAIGRYMDIFSANKDQLSNPDLIKVGQKLNIPAR
jgi:nucleoid-associated protein YgaU